MLQPVIGAIRSSHPARRFFRDGFILNLGLLMLVLSTPTAYPCSDLFQISSSLQQPIAANRAASQNSSEARLLAAGKPIERELAGGEAHAYQLTLAAGQYAAVVVDQQRINVALSAFDPNGKKIVEADGFSIGESELISFVADTSGAYRLEVRSPDQTAPKGRYEIKVKELRAATEQDKSLATAERLIAEGILLERQATADSLRQGIEKFQQSIPFCQSAKDPSWESTALYLMADAYIFLGEKQKAFDFANRALPLAQAAAKQPGEEQRRLGRKVEAIALVVLGRVHNEFGDKQKALDLFNQALPLRRAIGDRPGEVTTLNYMGTAYQLMGDYQKAMDSFNQALLIARELGDRGQEANLLNNICVIQNNLGEYKKAMEFCSQALSIRHDLKFSLGEATTLNNLSNAYSNLGDYQKALDSYTQAHAIYKVVGNPQGQAVALNNIGFIYATLGEYEKAIGFYNQGLEIFRAAGDQYREANILNNVAANYANMGEFRKALEINQQVLPLRRAVNDRDGEAVTFNNIANCYSNLGDRQKALDYYHQSLALHRALGNPRQLATALKNIGTLYRDLGEHQKALDYLNEGLQMARAIGDRNNEAGILAHLARLERDRGNLAAARSRIEEALAAVESLRINVKSYRLRAAFFASVRKHHEFNIDLLMRLHKQHPSEGFDAAALQASEKGRARSLLESLNEAGGEIRQGVDPPLLERERMLRQSISDKADGQMRLLSGKHTEDQAAAAAKEIEALTTDYEQVQAQIRQTSPRYAALTRPAPLTLKAIQNDVLDDETLLLEYALGEEKSFLWAVTPASIQSFELPKRAEIEEAARRVYEMLTARNQMLANETPEQRRKRIEQSDAEYPKTSAALSRMLLGPVAAELKSKRLIIVGEGLLQYTAFAALPTPDPRPGVVASPLIADHEVISLPSASVLAVLRQEAAGRGTPDKTVAVFADPVFDRNDPRIRLPGKDRATTVGEVAPAGDVNRSATESGLRDFVRLRFSRQEADQIARLASEGKRLEAVDFAANRATATSSELRHYAILHFATHGLINNQHPELSGVVLSLVDEQGHPQNGFLRLYDIYNLKLQANLVVLSACQTALGKEIKGEGLVGLTRGFMYAGAPRVVASLWQIDDRATAEFMGRFYEAMLRQGLKPAAALRAAQVSMWKGKRWQSPHYWAAFTLQGEWK
jgi:CHAT domain-containing protein/tetratricopeptide (TPR) repeat protein